MDYCSTKRKLNFHFPFLFYLFQCDGWSADKLIFLIYLYFHFLLSPFYGPLTLLLEAFIVGYLILVYFVSTTNLWTEHCFNCTNVQVQKRQTTHVFLHSRQIWTMFINIYKIKIFFQNISCFILYVLARAAVLGRHLGKFLALGCGGQHLKINYFPSSSSTSSSSLSS